MIWLLSIAVCVAAILPHSQGLRASYDVVVLTGVVENLGAAAIRLLRPVVVAEGVEALLLTLFLLVSTDTERLLLYPLECVRAVLEAASGVTADGGFRPNELIGRGFSYLVCSTAVWIVSDHFRFVCERGLALRQADPVLRPSSLVGSLRSLLIESGALLGCGRGQCGRH